MPLDSLRDGFVRVCFDPSANIYQGKCRILLEGQYVVDPTSTCLVVPDTLMQITSLKDVSCYFGAGSVLCESLKAAFGCCANNAVEIYAIPRQDAAGSVKAEYTMTVAGDAMTDGRIDIYWGEGAYNISLYVTEGMTRDEIAYNLSFEVMKEFPFIALASGNVVTFRAKNGGTVGNCLNAFVNWHARVNYMPEGVSLEWTQTVQGSGNPLPLDYNTVLGECCYCCIAMLYDDPAWQNGMIQYIEDAWSCDKPQCFGHGYTYNTGTPGQILATDTNSETISRIAQCCEDPILGYLKVAAYASHSCCATVDNPELNIQGPTFGVLSCLLEPESCTQCFSFDEQVLLRNSGFVVTVPVSGGTGSLTSPMITNDITNNRYDDEGRENATWLNVSSRRLAAETADEFAKQLQKYNGLGLYTKNTTIRPGVLGTNPRLILGDLRAWAKENVGVLFSEFEDIDNDITVKTDFEVAPKCMGKPDKLWVGMIYRPPVRVGQIQVNLVPKMLDNCY